MWQDARHRQHRLLVPGPGKARAGNVQGRAGAVRPSQTFAALHAGARRRRDRQ